MYAERSDMFPFLLTNKRGTSVNIIIGTCILGNKKRNAEALQHFGVLLFFMLSQSY